MLRPHPRRAAVPAPSGRTRAKPQSDVPRRGRAAEDIGPYHKPPPLCAAQSGHAPAVGGGMSDFTSELFRSEIVRPSALWRPVSRRPVDRSEQIC